MRFLLLSALAIWFVSCTSPTDSTPDVPNSEDTHTLTVEARPNAIPADGVSHTTIFVEYRPQAFAGHLVAAIVERKNKIKGLIILGKQEVSAQERKHQEQVGFHGV